MITAPDEKSYIEADSSTVRSQWGSFLSTQVMPILSGLMRGASENDVSILRTVYEILQDTAIPGADVANTVANLWVTYNTVYRPLLQSSKIPVTTDQALYSAKQYTERHSW